MSIRMNASLYSDLVRIERGDYLTFHCTILSQSQRDVKRYFFGAYYPRWRGFYLEEVREVVGTLGRMDLKHFPAFPFDVYTKPDGDYYLTSDFQVDSVITLGGPQNQRDDDVKRFKIVSVDTEHLKTFHDNNNNSSIAKLQNTFLDTQGKRHEVAPLSGEAYDYLLMIRDAYILHVGGGVPEIGIKAMGRPFRKVSDDGRRWITRESMKILIRDARCFGSEAISFSSTNKSKKSVEEVSTLLYDAFPEEDGKGVDYDVFITAVRGEMNATRKDAVLHIFRSLDYDNDGLLKILDLQSTFNASEHPSSSRIKYFPRISY
ncbi:calcium-binding protein [Angomonas deanei]|uniref:EF-hand domain-containing protein n=1 Tax=Angomonas deanei TaxID=59799 RepID=A0A7G2CFT1_9TRYP|nr:calcium-binding protein [Angomonas deanei]CAD2218205.1 hypothetical protein, conserved [Angomonas deanei]|eukprot:EPY25816.1 calcium-binding protein [Angomonas deanei]